MRLLIVVIGAVLATPGWAEPAGSISPMTLPGQGYLQPGNPSRGVTMIGRESGMVRQRQGRTVTCASRGGRTVSCQVGRGEVRLVERIGGRCRTGRDWYQARRAVVVTNNCRAVFTTRR